MSQNKVNLTADRVRKFVGEPGQAQAFLWDATAKGLAVRAVAGSKKKSFIWQGKLAGKAMRVTIGDVTAWGIDDARERARDMQVMVDKGIDPRVAKAQAIAEQVALRQEEARNTCTVLEAFKSYIDYRKTHKSGRKKQVWGARHIKRHEGYIDPGGKPYGRGKQPGWGDVSKPGILYPLMSMPLVDLTTGKIKDWLSKASDSTPTEAGNAYRSLRAFLNWCAEKPEYNVSAAQITNEVRELVPALKVKTDCLQREQIKTWFAAVRSLPNQVISAYLQTLLLTGARRNELVGLRWADVDFQWGSMTIRDKVDGQRTIPLTPYVATILHALPRRNEFVFSSTGRRGAATDGKPDAAHITGPTKAHTDVLAKVELPHIILHGLRRSFSTLSEWCEIPTGVIAQIMGHKPSATAEKHYKPRPIDLLRKYHSTFEQWILGEAGIEFDAAAAKKGLHLVQSNAAA